MEAPWKRSNDVLDYLKNNSVFDDKGCQPELNSALISMAESNKAVDTDVGNILNAAVAEFKPGLTGSKKKREGQRAYWYKNWLECHYAHKGGDGYEEGCISKNCKSGKLFTVT